LAWDEPMFGRAPGDPHDPGDHFVPPEPPPLPKRRKGALVILLLFVLGLVLLLAPSLLGMAASIATSVGMLSLAAGLALLLLRVRQGPPPGADPRSEERRVGKEERTRLSPEHEHKSRKRSK